MASGFPIEFHNPASEHLGHSRDILWGVPSKIEWFDDPSCIRRILKLVTYPDGDNVRLRILANTHLMTEEPAKNLIETLCNIISDFSKDPHATVAIVGW
jgi:hypothetical protein